MRSKNADVTRECAVHGRGCAGAERGSGGPGGDAVHGAQPGGRAGGADVGFESI